MGKKKSKRTSPGDSTSTNGASAQPVPPSTAPTISAPPPAPARKSTGLKPTDESSLGPPLYIGRNKHWRYISSFHGPWIQLPHEILESLAIANYNTPRPRPVDPAVFFDLLKIRRLVDDATDICVRAASGIASSATSSLVNSLYHPASAVFLTLGGRETYTKLSRERIHRMRELATQKLSKAYRLDEIACSVSTMQGASTLEDVASLVLQRSPNDRDARYVHFFHEKIPSRQLEECTSLRPLDDIIAERPTEAEPLRTRATVRILKKDYEGAVVDLTTALHVYRFHHPSHKQQQQQLLEQQKSTRRQQDIVLTEGEQPSSLEVQLLFQRATTYLTLACKQVEAALPSPPLGHPQLDEHLSAVPEHLNHNRPPATELLPEEKEKETKREVARKAVKQYAKRALRDYLAYLSQFEYSPNLPVDIAEEFCRKVNNIGNDFHIPRPPATHSTRSESPTGDAVPKLYALSELFNASPPQDLPPFPPNELIPLKAQSATPLPEIPPATTTETVTFHPLLTDALHALLICHTLMQTSPKELLRHAYMVGRISRLADGYPIFQSCRSPARTDWIDLLRTCDNWIHLSMSWEALCMPVPIPLFQTSASGTYQSVPLGWRTHKPAAQVGNARPAKVPPGEPEPTPSLLDLREEATAFRAVVAADSARRELEAHVALLRDENHPLNRRDPVFRSTVLARQRRAEDDYRVSLESPTIRGAAAIIARQRRADEDHRIDSAVAALDAKFAAEECADGAASAETGTVTARQDAVVASGAANANAAADGEAGPDSSNGALAQAGIPATSTPRSGTDVQAITNAHSWTADSREYPAMTERASAVARWVLEAPVGAGSTGGVGKRKKKMAVVDRTKVNGSTTDGPIVGGGAGSDDTGGDDDAAAPLVG